MPIAEVALRANYRVSRVEIALLELIDNVTRQRVLSAIVDGPSFIELFEKKTLAEADTSDTNNGP